ncbi:MAG: rhodanese-like domain-containing protein [Lachnotalea sp.]
MMRLGMISANDIDQYINNSRYLLVDLREKKDYIQSHIENAIYMDYEDIENNKVTLPRNKMILLYCDRGGLSLMAARKLSYMGYNVKSVIGGIYAYKGKNKT